MAGRIITLMKAKHTQRVNKTGKNPVCYSCGKELKVGDRIHSKDTTGSRDKLSRWRCLSCAKRLNLAEDDDN